MHISVAMATCNGARYLAEQLASILHQDRLPQEMVVCDDRSSDQTPAILRQFAATAPLEVRIEINDRRLGAAANFAKAVGLCRGEWIVLADQDDIWLPGRIRRLAGVLEEDPGVGLVFSDALLADCQGRPLGQGLWQTIGFSPRERRRVQNGRAADVLLRRNVVTGATMAFRAEYRDLVLPIPPGWLHDAWIALLVSAVASCRAIEEPLLLYRQHPDQQIGEKRRGLYEQYRRVREMGHADFQRVADNYAAARDRLLLFRRRLRDASLIGAIRRKVDHFRAKARMREAAAWRWPLVGRELAAGHYARYSLGWKSLAQDLFL